MEERYWAWETKRFPGLSRGLPKLLPFGKGVLMTARILDLPSKKKKKKKKRDDSAKHSLFRRAFPCKLGVTKNRGQGGEIT